MLHIPWQHQKYNIIALQWRHNERDCVWNHRRLDSVLNRFFRRRSKKTSKLHVTGLCEGNSPVTGEFPAQKPVARKMFPFDDAIIDQISDSQKHPLLALASSYGSILSILEKDDRELSRVHCIV